MSECLYCCTDDNQGDLLEIILPLGMLGKAHTECYISTMNKYNDARLHGYTWLEDETGAEVGPTYVADVSEVPFNYCPVCGRRLNGN